MKYLLKDISDFNGDTWVEAAINRSLKIVNSSILQGKIQPEILGNDVLDFIFEKLKILIDTRYKWNTCL